LTKEEKNRLKAFEMRMWRRMEKVGWINNTTEDSLHMIQEDRKILNIIQKCKHKWLGHMLKYSRPRHMTLH